MAPTMSRTPPIGLAEGLRTNTWLGSVGVSMTAGLQEQSGEPANNGMQRAALRAAADSEGVRHIANVTHTIADRIVGCLKGVATGDTIGKQTEMA